MFIKMYKTQQKKENNQCSKTYAYAEKANLFKCTTAPDARTVFGMHQTA